jgi:hypothetical protein
MWPFFSSGGSVGATGEAARGWPAVAPCTPGVAAKGGRRRAVGWADRKAVAQWGRGGKSSGKRKRRLGRKAGWVESDGENYFPNKN